MKLNKSTKRSGVTASLNILIYFFPLEIVQLSLTAATVTHDAENYKLFVFSLKSYILQGVNVSHSKDCFKSGTDAILAHSPKIPLNESISRKLKL